MSAGASNEVEEALRPLGGLRLLRVGRAADLLWLHFGAWRATTDHRGGVRTVGEWALHVQCPWRFTRDARILTAWRDLHQDADTSRPYNERAGAESHFDRVATALNGELETVAHHVENVAGNLYDGFRLAFDPELGFEAFPCAATLAPRHEFWRLFRPDTRDRHRVFGTLGPKVV